MAKRNTDWEGVHRDFRTGKFTLRELAFKYGTSHQAIGAKAKRDGWEKDLGDEIRAATNAVLVRELVNSEIAKTGQEVANTVVVAAEQNAEIIRNHRKRLTRSWQLVEVAKDKAFELADEVTDVLTLTKLVQAMANTVGTEKHLIELERKSYGIDNEKEEKASTYEELLSQVAEGGK